jgi:mutator protein MutT
MNSQQYSIHKAAGIIIKDRKLLVEKSIDKNFYISPGGSIESGETPEEALTRELMEEFTITVDKNDLTPFDIYYANAANDPDKVVKMEVFIVNKFSGTIAPSHEVELIEWVNSFNDNKLPLGSIFEKEVIPKLKSLNLID